MYKRVPRELKELPQWVCWRLVEDPDRPGKKKKIPIDPRTGGPARSNDPATWAAYEDAVEGQDRFRADGIGIMFANGIFGIDLDHCLDEGGQLLPFAREILDTVQSYAELSPSGTGIHILCAGQLPEGRRRRGNVEMYSEGRFFTVTGHQIGTEYEFSDCTHRVKEMHRKYLGQPERPREAPQRPPRNARAEMSPEEVIRRATAAKRGGERFADFMAGGGAVVPPEHRGRLPVQRRPGVLQHPGLLVPAGRGADGRRFPPVRHDAPKMGPAPGRDDLRPKDHPRRGGGLPGSLDAAGGAPERAGAPGAAPGSPAGGPGATRAAGEAGLSLR